MKKSILCFIICAVFLGISAPSFANSSSDKKDVKVLKKEELKAQKLAKEAEKKKIKELRKKYKAVSSDMKIIEALETMKNTPAIGAYDMIMGDNNTEKPVKIEFKNLGKMRKKYTNLDAINGKKTGTLYIYVDKRHESAPKEAVAALISGMPVHINDKKNSVNEESYAWAVEAVIWNYLSKQNPEVLNQRSRLVDREEILLERYEKSPKDARYILDTVREKRGDIRYDWESPGYNHKEYSAKIERLYGIYNKNNAVLEALGNKNIPVSNTDKNIKVSPKADGDKNTALENPKKEAAADIEPKCKAGEECEKYINYSKSPVPASFCKAPCSAQGKASCPGSCSSNCPNKRNDTK